MKDKKTPVILLVLTLALILTTGATLAKYKAQETGGDSARVAGFDVTMTSEATQVVLDATTDLRESTYTFTVTSNSEVAVSYDMVVTFSAPVPNGMTLSMNGTSHQGDGTVSSFSFPGNTMEPGSTSQENILTISADFEILQEDYNPEVTVTMTAKQVN